METDITNMYLEYICIQILLPFFFSFFLIDARYRGYRPSEGGVFLSSFFEKASENLVGTDSNFSFSHFRLAALQ